MHFIYIRSIAPKDLTISIYAIINKRSGKLLEQ